MKGLILGAILAMGALAPAALASETQLDVWCGLPSPTKFKLTELTFDVDKTVRENCQDKANIVFFYRGTLSPMGVTKAIRVLQVAKDLGIVRPLVQLDSPGGDVGSALRLGRYFFATNAAVSTRRCYSACAVAIAGAVVRTYDDTDGLALGIHRPFETRVVSPSASSKELTAKYDAVELRLRSWFREMGVSQQLTDLMMSTPSTDVRRLTAKERADFGIGFDNVTAKEMARERRVAGCDPDTARRLEAAWDDSIVCLARGGLFNDDERIRACDEAANAKYGVKLGEKCTSH